MPNDRKTKIKRTLELTDEEFNNIILCLYLSYNITTLTTDISAPDEKDADILIDNLIFRHVVKTCKTFNAKSYEKFIAEMVKVYREEVDTDYGILNISLKELKEIKNMQNTDTKWKH